jgi:glycosyltransferase involved in cell wall biosynthesis
MRLALLTPEYVMQGNVDGGLANYVKKTAKSLSNKSVTTWVFVYSNRNTIWHDEKVTVCEISSKIIIFDYLLKVPKVRGFYKIVRQILLSKKLSKKLWKCHKKNPFHIIQTSSYLTPGLSVLNNRRVPVVCRISSYTPLLRSAYGRQRSITEYLTDWLEIRQVLDADASFSPSQLIVKAFSRIEGYTPFIIRTPLEETDIEYDYSFYYKHKPDKRYFLFFGTLSKIKGVDILAKAISIILNNNTSIGFILIGRDGGLPCGKMCFDFIKDMCDKNESNVVYHKALPKSKLYPFIANAEAVIIPSRVDNYPNSCLESISLGIPVIGTYDSSLEEIIIDGKTGSLIANESVTELVSEINRYIKLNETDRSKIRQNCLNHAIKMSQENRVDELIKFYKSTIKSYSIKR